MSGTLRLGYAVSSNTNTTTFANTINLAGGNIFVDDAYQYLTGTVNVTQPGAMGSTYNNGSNGAGERDKGLFLDGILTGSADLTLRHSGIVGGANYHTSIVHFANNANTYSGDITVLPMSGTSTKRNTSTTAAPAPITTMVAERFPAATAKTVASAAMSPMIAVMTPCLESRVTVSRISPSSFSSE